MSAKKKVGITKIRRVLHQAAIDPRKNKVFAVVSDMHDSEYFIKRAIEELSLPLEIRRLDFAINLLALALVESFDGLSLSR